MKKKRRTVKKCGLARGSGALEQDIRGDGALKGPAASSLTACKAPYSRCHVKNDKSATHVAKVISPGQRWKEKKRDEGLRLHGTDEGETAEGHENCDLVADSKT